MNNKEKQKAHEYFNNKYGEDYTNRGHLMSFGYSTLPRLIRYSKHLSPDAKICYETLTDMIMNTEMTNPLLYFPSQKRIAFLSGMRRENANKALRELNKANLIGVKRRGQGKQNIYCVLAPPAEFIEEALQARAVLNLIQRNEISWNDISDDGKVNCDVISAKIEAEKSIIPFDVTNNALQEVIEKKPSLLNADTDNSPNSQSQQEVICENPPQPIPPQVARAIPEKQELTSVDITSEESSSSVVFSKVNSLDTLDKGTQKNDDDSEKEIFGSDFKTINNTGPQQNTASKIAKVRNQTPPTEIGNEYFLTIEQLLDKKNINVPLTFKNFAIVKKMYEGGVPLELVVKTIIEVISRAKGKKIRSFKYFEDAIWENFNRRKSNDNATELTQRLLNNLTKNRDNVNSDGKNTPQTLEEAINKKEKVTR